MGHDTDESAVTELTLFVDNDGDLYRQHAVPIFTNLVTKMARGVYDHARAVQAFSYLAEAGAKKYAREHGGGESEWHRIFPIEVRRKAAEAWAKSFEGEAELGNYDRLLPKKYQKPAPAPASSRTKHTRAYTDGYNLASDASSNLSEAEIEHIVATDHMWLPTKYRKYAKSPDFARGYLTRMRAVLDAMRGN